MTDAAGTRTFVYDAATLQLDYEEVPDYYGDTVRLDRQYAVSGVIGRNVGFDVVGVPAGTPTTLYSVAYGYYDDGRLETVTNDSLPGSPQEFTYGYVDGSDLIKYVEGPVARADNTYEPLRDLRTVVNNYRIADGSSSPVSHYSYRYDAAGRRSDVVNSGEVFPGTDALSVWAYDTRSQVTGQSRYEGDDPDNPGNAIAAGDFAYDYDTIGNRLTSTGAGTTRDYYALTGTSEPGANMLNQYKHFSGPETTFAYDTDGNMTQNLASDASGVDWYYTWNGENRLIRARTYSATSAPDAEGEISVQFVYDYLGRRIEKYVREYTGGELVETRTRYLYDEWNAVMAFEWDATNETYVAGDSCTWGLDLSNTLQGAGGVGGLLMEGARYPFYDANGNIGQKLAANGNVDMAVEYGPFGEITSGTLVGDYAFSTKPYDASTGLYYYIYRYYGPGLGRWISRDRIKENGGLNLYGFIRNDGVNRSDYLGLVGTCCKDECQPLGSITDVQQDGISFQYFLRAVSPDSLEDIKYGPAIVGAIGKISTAGGAVNTVAAGTATAVAEAGAEFGVGEAFPDFAGAAMEMLSDLETDFDNKGLAVWVKVKWTKCIDRRCPRGPNTRRHNVKEERSAWWKCPYTSVNSISIRPGDKNLHRIISKCVSSAKDKVPK